MAAIGDEIGMNLTTPIVLVKDQVGLVVGMSPVSLPSLELKAHRHLRPCRLELLFGDADAAVFIDFA